MEVDFGDWFPEILMVAAVVIIGITAWVGIVVEKKRRHRRRRSRTR